MRRFFCSVFIMTLFVLSCYSDQETIGKKLQKIAIQAKPDYFSINDEFNYLGKIDKYDIAYNKSLWGNGRMSGRIIIFADDKTIGSYGVINDQPEVCGNKLVFTEYEKKYGNEIDLNQGILKQIYLDGELFQFEFF